MDYHDEERHVHSRSFREKYRIELMSTCACGRRSAIFYCKEKNCPYKDRCSFAHGEHELRLIVGPGGMGSGGSPPMMPPPPQQQ
jgi:hypothetical protein